MIDRKVRLNFRVQMIWKSFAQLLNQNDKYFIKSNLISQL